MAKSEICPKDCMAFCTYALLAPSLLTTSMLYHQCFILCPKGCYAFRFSFHLNLWVSIWVVSFWHWKDLTETHSLIFTHMALWLQAPNNIIWPTVNSEYANCIFFALKMFWDVIREKRIFGELSCLLLHPFFCVKCNIFSK